MTTFLKTIPYVNGVPDDGQQSIRWVVNGELLGGATTKKGFDGVLNAAPSQIQENIVVLDDNIKSLGGISTNIDERLKIVELFVEESGNESLIQKVNDNTTDIKTLQDKSEIQQSSINGMDTIINGILTDVGTPSPENGIRNIYEDLLFIKKRIGSNIDEDFNGNPSIGDDSTGLIHVINSSSMQSAQNRNNILSINQRLETADLDQLKINDEKFREEIGDIELSTSSSIYVRLKSHDQSLLENTTSINQIKESIDFGNIEVADEINGLVAKTNSIENDLNDPTTGMHKQLNDLDKKVNDPSTGLVAEVGVLKLQNEETETSLSDLSTKYNQLELFVGAGANPSDDSISKKLAELTALQNDTAATVQDIQVELGNAQSGMIKDIIDLKAAVADLTARVVALESK